MRRTASQFKQDAPWTEGEIEVNQMLTKKLLNLNGGRC